MRLFFANGPGDVVMSLKNWRDGVRGPCLIPLTYSSLVFGVLRRQNVDALFISQHPNIEKLQVGRIKAKNVPKQRRFRWLGKSLSYHLGQLAYGLFLWKEARRFGAEIAIIDSGSAHWFVFSLFEFSRIPVVPNFHNTYENPGEPLGPLAKLVRALDRLYFRRFTSHAMGVSENCRIAIDEGLCQQERHWQLHSISYKASDFEHFSPNPPLFGQLDKAPFRLLFVGRLEENKGVLDLPNIVSILLGSGVNLVLEICGDGDAKSALQARIQKAQLANRVTLTGLLDRDELLQAYRRCHAVIVPSHLSFKEGFPAVCAEACLALRPVISSRISNSKGRLGDAMLIAEVQNNADFARKIQTLATDPPRYQVAIEAAMARRTSFTRPDIGMGEALSRLLPAMSQSGVLVRKSSKTQANSLN